LDRNRLVPQVARWDVRQPQMFWLPAAFGD
jgi:hypothetical protein